MPGFLKRTSSRSRGDSSWQKLCVKASEKFRHGRADGQRQDMTTKQDMVDIHDWSSSSDIVTTPRVHYTEEIDYVAKASCFPSFSSLRLRAAPISGDRGLFSRFGSFSSSSSEEQRHPNFQLLASYPGRPSCVIRPLDERLRRRRDRTCK